MVEVSQRGRVLKPGEVTYSVVRVVSQRDGRSDDTTEIEYGPEDADELSLLVFGGVRKHQRALRCPKESGAHAKNRPSRDHETPGVLVDIHCSVLTLHHPSGFQK